MKVRINPNHIHHFNTPEGDELQLDVQFPEYPELPTYGLRVDFPITKAKVLDAIKVKAQQAKAQMEADQAIRDKLGTDILEFDVEV